jgi:hypothetical protein
VIKKKKFDRLVGYIGEETSLSEQQAYELIWTDEVLKHIRQRSNKRLSERRDKLAYLNNGQPPPSITKEEIKTFFAIILAMSVAPQPNLKDYWRTDHVGDNVLGNKFIANRMSRDRFLVILRCLHYNLDWIMAELMRNGHAVWRPFRRIAIDETLIAFKGMQIFFRSLTVQDGQNCVSKYYASLNRQASSYGLWQMIVVSFGLGHFIENRRKRLQTPY